MPHDMDKGAVQMPQVTFTKEFDLLFLGLLSLMKVNSIQAKLSLLFLSIVLLNIRVCGFIISFMFFLDKGCYKFIVFADEIITETKRPYCGVKRINSSFSNLLRTGTLKNAPQIAMGLL